MFYGHKNLRIHLRYTVSIFLRVRGFGCVGVTSSHGRTLVLLDLLGDVNGSLVTSICLIQLVGCRCGLPLAAAAAAVVVIAV